MNVTGVPVQGVAVVVSVACRHVSVHGGGRTLFNLFAVGGGDVVVVMVFRVWKEGSTSEDVTNVVVLTGQRITALRSLDNRSLTKSSDY